MVEEEEEIQEAALRENLLKKDRIKSVKYVKKVAMLRKIAGSKGSYNAETTRSLGICKKIVDLEILNKHTM